MVFEKEVEREQERQKEREKEKEQERIKREERKKMLDLEKERQRQFDIEKQKELEKNKKGVNQSEDNQSNQAAFTDTFTDTFASFLKKKKEKEEIILKSQQLEEKEEVKENQPSTDSSEVSEKTSDIIHNPVSYSNSFDFDYVKSKMNIKYFNEGNKLTEEQKLAYKASMSKGNYNEVYEKYFKNILL